MDEMPTWVMTLNYWSWVWIGLMLLYRYQGDVERPSQREFVTLAVLSLCAIGIITATTISAGSSKMWIIAAFFAWFYLLPTPEDEHGWVFYSRQWRRPPGRTYRRSVGRRCGF